MITLQNNSKTFLNELANQFSIGDTSSTEFLINIFITIILSYVLGLIYAKHGSSLSNRKKLKQTFVLMAVTVMIVITIVKSSLALSLGLVGALSIVRFRTAIKEPEELVYFFIAIAIGLGMGANQRLLTLVGVAIIAIYIIIQNINSEKQEVLQNLIVTVSNTSNSELNEKEIIGVLKKYCSRIDLRRLDEANSTTELSFSAEFKSLENILEAKTELKKVGSIQFSFIEAY
ncbi:DUF4956 domain-containing protein [Flavobacteriaceae bacterium]|jgi:hypothetical protein|nr:DUF4956 domain-containing protein [Flavobacteriaceae bacterium]MDA9907104.1 DUF4956 domain-containing protein [Flavobacteriaceae bacterium]MDB3865859.1 DUF4956 domain-containing protein [bacterium]